MENKKIENFTTPKPLNWLTQNLTRVNYVGNITPLAKIQSDRLIDGGSVVLRPVRATPCLHVRWLWQRPRRRWPVKRRRQSTRKVALTSSTWWRSVQTAQRRWTRPTLCRTTTGCCYQSTCMAACSASKWSRSSTARAGGSLDCPSTSREHPSFESASETSISPTGWARTVPTLNCYNNLSSQAWSCYI